MHVDFAVQSTTRMHAQVPSCVSLAARRYDLNRKPYLYYSLADKEGNLVHDYPVDIPDPVM